MKTYHVRADWDSEAKVWVAVSDDVPGLATGADTLEGLVAKLRIMVPELLELNGVEDAGTPPYPARERRATTAARSGQP